MSHSPRPRLLGVVLAGASVLALTSSPVLAAASPAAPRAARDPVVLDTGRVLALAGDGTRTAWLHAEYGPNGGKPTAVQLWTRDAAGTVARVRDLPRTADQIALGDDRSGRSTVVFTAAGGSSTALYALPFDGSAAPRALRASRPAGAESSPGLRDGVLSFARLERTRRNGVRHDTVRLGSLTSQTSRIVSDGKRGTGVVDTLPTAGDGVAYVTRRPDDAGAVFELRVLRAGRSSTLLSRTAFGGASAAGFGNLVTTDGGTHLVATRWEDGGGHPADRTVYRVPSGTEVGAATTLLPGEQDLGVPVRGGHVYVDHDLPMPFDPDGQLVFRADG